MSCWEIHVEMQCRIDARPEHPSFPLSLCVSKAHAVLSTPATLMPRAWIRTSAAALLARTPSQRFSCVCMCLFALAPFMLLICPDDRRRSHYYTASLLYSSSSGLLA